jgi:hypothetical protein
MDELRVLLMPPRCSVLLLSGAMSSSMLRGDSEIECLLEKLDNGTFDDDEHVFSVKTLVAILHIVVALTHNKYTGLLAGGKKTQRTYYDYYFLEGGA